MKRIKSFTHSEGVLIVEYDDSPRIGEPTLVLTIKVASKPDEVYRSWGKLHSHTHRDVEWWVGKYAPTGSGWALQFGKWWVDEAWPSIQPRPKYNPKKKW